jgi:predicted amidohydrolase YtcJ
MCNSCVANPFGLLDSFRAEPTRTAFLAGSAGALGALAAGLPRIGRAATGAADTIIWGGTIYPVAASSQKAEAVAIRNGKIVAVGTRDEVSGLKDGMTRVVDLDGRVLFPGFIDAHQHTLTGALIAEFFNDVGYPKFKTQQSVLDAIKADVGKKPSGAWTYVTNFDNLLQGGELTIDQLDAISTMNPIMVYYINMHTATVNTAAMKAANVDESIGDLPGGGRFGRDSSGKLNGLVYEPTALAKFVTGLPKITPEIAGKAVVSWLKINAAAGNTMVHEPGVLVFGNVLESYEKIAQGSPARVSISLVYDSLKEGSRYQALGIGANATQLPESFLSLYAIKIVGDGSNQTMSAAQTVPYLGTSEKGHLNFDPPTMKKMVTAVKEAGWAASIHGNGDAAIDNALDAIEAVYGPSPSTGVNRIEHCTITRPEQIKRMKALGVQPSFLMNHVYFYGAAYRDQLFGPERANRMDAAAQCVQVGLPFTLHTDAPCSNIGTLQLVQTAVTRICSVDGSVVGADQAITVDEAMKAVTVYAAGQVGMADRLGTIEVGKEADLTILESDPYTVDASKIMDIKVSQTWVAGTTSYDSSRAS